MEIKTSSVNQTIANEQVSSSSKQASESDARFADELKDLKKSEELKKGKEDKNEKEEVKSEKSAEEEAKDGKVEEAIDDLADAVLKINRTDDYAEGLIKDMNNKTDINMEGADVINNDYNIENKDLLPQMMPNMNFGGDGQPFSSFMNDGGRNENKNELSSSAKDLAEEAAILSTMAENIAMANKNMIAQDEKTVVNESGITKVNTKTNMLEDTIVKYDTILMSEADVEMFANLVDGKDVYLNELTAESAQKSAQVSKTLADMLAKAMEDNKPIRIEFDNGISVIIKISRDGKLSADFLPSTQIAEAYLKENLPILKQRLSDQNLDYDQLNQRERQNREREQNRKKGNENE